MTATAKMETRRLDGLPALPPLYAKALAGSLPLIGSGGDALPDHALEVEALEIDRDPSPPTAGCVASACGKRCRRPIHISSASRSR